VLGPAAVVALLVAQIPDEPPPEPPPAMSESCDSPGCRVLGELPECEVDAWKTLRSRKGIPRANSNAYRLPISEEIESLTGSIIALVNGDAPAALSMAAGAAYQLCRGWIGENGVALWYAERGTGNALIAWRPEESRPLILSVPHPISDARTLDQGVALFEGLRARALIVAGTHRCANENPAGCNGSTKVCRDDTGVFRESDMAHVDGSIFQAAHRAFARQFTRDIVVSLHGMGYRGVVVSDGTVTRSSTTAFVSRLAKSLKRVFPGERVLNCNEDDHVPQVALCGTTNVQGQYLNLGEDGVCTMTATVASGRFLHLEQSRTVRKKLSKLVEAFERAMRRFVF
jgi:hypothetical protein